MLLTYCFVIKMRITYPFFTLLLPPKKYTLMRIIYSFFFLLLSFFTQAQSNVSWDFTTATPSAGLPVSNLTISAVSQGNNNGTTTLLTTTSASSGYTGASGTSNGGAAARIGALNTTASGSAYFEFTLTPATGFTVNLSAINFGTRSTGTGPQAYSVKTSLNSFGADAATGTIANNSTWSLKTNTTNVTSTSGTPLVVRIYGYSGAGSPSASTANWRIDDLFITVTVVGSGADITPPLATNFNPADEATNVPTSTNLSILFNEPIQKGTGNILLKKISDNSIIETIDVTNAAVTVTSSTATITINPLAINTAYYVEIAPTAFKDLANNDYAGIVNNSTWNFTTGSNIFNANFSACTSTLSNGFTAFSVTGAQFWACTTFGYAGTPTGSAASGVQINGFASGSNVINEDWLISPSFNLVGTAFPLLSFYSRTAFNGAPLKLKVSTNYTGTGNPNAATWIDLNGGFPLQASDVWKLSQNINLTAYKTANTYIAFVYNSTDDDGARWTLDDIKIDNSATPPPASLTPSTGEVNFGFVANATTAVKTITLNANDIVSAVTLNATGNFLISKTNGSFTPSISYSIAEANNIPQTVYIQFAPTAPTVSYLGNLIMSTTSVADTVIVLKGNSIDAATTLDVVNWNIEWFGSPTLGPTNDNLQEQNIKTVLQNLNADVYALQEVVSEARLANVVSQMPGYAYILSDYGSRSNPNQPGAGTLAEAQKLGLIYKTALFPGGVTGQALLSAGINSAADITNPAYNWFSSGRFPYMVTGTTTLNGATKTIRFIIVHAKANTSPTLTSYQRRKAGNDSLLINLNTFYPNDNIIMLGDFNDDLDSTITAGINPKLSSYKQFVDDAARFTSPTLALSLAGKKSTVSFNDVIDHVLISNELQCTYLAGSAAILTDVTSLIPSYGSTTTDHFPVYTRYLFEQPSTATVSYSGSPYCSNAGTVNNTFSGSAGGTYSSTTGLSINSTTGAINTSTSTPGNYVVTYTIAATACNPAFTTTSNITITAAPVATISYTGSPFCNVAGIGVVTRTGNAGGTYSSNTGLVINATTGEVNTLTSTPGSYVVTYTITAAGGCAVYTTTANITINALSVAPTSATATKTLICGGNEFVNLTAIGGSLGAGASYKWYSGSCGGLLVGTGATVNNAFVGTTTTTFFVRIEGTCGNTTCASVTVNVAPAPVVTLTQLPTTGLLPGSPVTITASVTPPAAYTYTWVKNNTINIANNTNSLLVNAIDAGNYAVTATAPSGCTVSSPSILVRSATSNTLYISANPNRGNFNVSFNNGEPNLNGRILSIYDSKGARVYTKTFSVNVPFGNMNIDLTSKGKGVYYIILHDGGGKKLADGSVEVL
jgi:endonuclease/exonuclease/phosphatase family metal-dependent hydrolase